MNPLSLGTADESPRAALRDLSRLGAGLPDWRGIARAPEAQGLKAQALRAGAVSGRYVVLGIEALAVYSLLRSQRSGAPEEDPDRELAALETELPQMLVLASARTSGGSAAHAGGLSATGWREDERRISRESALAGASATAAPAAASTAGTAAVSGAEGSRGLRAVLRLAHRVGGVVDALRGLNLNSFRLSESTRLKVDGRTGHRSRVMFVVTHRF